MQAHVSCESSVVTVDSWSRKSHQTQTFLQQVSFIEVSSELWNAPLTALETSA